MTNTSSSSAYETIMDSVAETVMKKGKRGVAAVINTECQKKPPYQHLESVLDVILSPKKKIDDSDNIDWCKWLIAGGRSPPEFATIGNSTSSFFLSLACFVTYCVLL